MQWPKIAAVSAAAPSSGWCGNQYFTLRVKPPSTVRFAPVIHDALFEARNSTALAIQADPARPGADHYPLAFKSQIHRAFLC